MSQIYKPGAGSGPGDYFSLSPYIVGSDVHSEYTTISSAITAAIADGASETNPKNIYIKPKNGGYTENLTLVDGINLVGFNRSALIIGKITMTATGQASVYGCTLRTNADYIAEITGSNAVELIFDDCAFEVLNSNAFHCTNASGALLIRKSDGTCNSSYTYWIFTAGGCTVSYSLLFSNGSVVNSTFDNAAFNSEFSWIYVPLVTTNAGSLTSFKSTHIVTNASTISINGTIGANIIEACRLDSGTAETLKIGAATDCVVVLTAMYTTNTNAITGLGTLKYGFITFYGTGSGVTVSGQTPLATLI